MDSKRMLRLVVELEDMCKHISKTTECSLDDEGVIVDRVSEDDPQIYIKV